MSILAASRQITCKVEIYSGNVLQQTLLPTDYIVNAKITRLGTDGKFWGYTYCQQLEVTLLDKDRVLDIDEGQIAKIKLGCIVDGVDDYHKFPDFVITTASRNEKDNTLNITAHDAMWQADKCKWSDITLTAPYTVNDIAAAIGVKLGISVNWGVTTTNRNISYTAANYDGSESLRQVLEDIAEITGTICFIDKNNQVKFKVLEQTGTPYSITRDDYFDLSTQKAYGAFGRLIHQTELGDNVDLGTEGATSQVLVENGLVSARDDITAILTVTKAINDGLTIYPYTLTWRGNPAIGIGDRISLTTKDNETVITYLLSDSLTYDGGLVSEATFSRGTADQTEPAASNTIGNALKTAKATVDKANQRITLLAQDTNDKLAQVEITTDSITSTVAENKAEAQNNLNTAKTQLQSQIEQTASSITSTVTANKTELEGDIADAKTELQGSINTVNTNLQSQIEQTASSITSTVSANKTEAQTNLNNAKAELQGDIADVQTNLNTVNTSLQSQIEQTASNITSTVAANKTELQGDITALDEALQSQIEQTAAGINATVSSNKTELQTAITNTGTTAQSNLNSAKTELQGNINSVNTQVQTNTSDIASLELTTQGITSTVSNNKTVLETAISNTATTAQNNLNAAKTELQGDIADVQTNINTVNTQLQSQISQTASSINATIFANETSTDQQFTNVNEGLSELAMTTGQITATGSENKAMTDNILSDIQNNINSLSQSVSATMTTEDIQIAISSAVENGTASSVQTTTTTVNNDGLNIAKSGIDLSVKAGYEGENAGFYVKSNDDNILAATNQGVEAQNLRVVDFIDIGNKCRIEYNGDTERMCVYMF